MAIQCVAASRVCRNLIWQTQDSFLNNVGTKRQLWHLCSKHRMSKGPMTYYRYYSRTALTRNGDKQLLSKCRNSIKCKTEKQIPRFVVRPSMPGQITKWRIYCTKTHGDAALVKSGKKAASPKMSEVKRLLSLAIPEKKPIFFGICLLFISSAVTITVPFAMGKVIDIIYSSQADDGVNMMDSLTKLCGVLSIVFLCGAAANTGRIYLIYTAGQRIIKRLREKVFHSIIRQEIGFFDKTRTGELVNRLSTDSSLIGQAVTSNVSDGLRSTVQAIGGIGMMFYSSVKLASVVLGIVPPVAVLAIVYGRYVRNISKQVQDSLASATEVAEERLSNIRTVRAFSHETREMEAYSTKVDKVLDLSKYEAKLQGLFYGSMGLSGNLIILSVLYNGGKMMTDAQITVGDLSAFLMYAAYVGISIGGLSSFYTGLMKGIGASTRLWELMDKQPTIPIQGGSVPALSSVVQGEVTFSNVNFAYPMRHDMTILSGFNLVVPAGKITAVVGSSGSGKSTLGSLLLRYYDPDNGDISLDGTNIKSLDPRWLRHQIGTVSQDPILFSRSIAENIAYGAENPDLVTTAEIIEAARYANAYDFVQGFTDQFDTVVGERGLMLSGGQRQRIALARAILKNPKILLLDEATSALDAESEHLVQEALERLMVGRTVITIAHRLSTIKRAHAIAVLQNGTIAELGPYEKLMSYQDGAFRKLVERQTVLND